MILWSAPAQTLPPQDEGKGVVWDGVKEMLPQSNR